MLSLETFQHYWLGSVAEINILICLNLAGALLLGMLVGYERSYNGRAAGMRTYGLVCMASAGLTIITGYSSAWFGGSNQVVLSADPTRVIQGIVTGIGFLCAGLIMRAGFKISGLTTAASLWASSVVGILVGIGFYPSAIVLALLSAICMGWISKLQDWLPARQTLAITLKFKKDVIPVESYLREKANGEGYDIAGDSISITLKDGAQEWGFVAIARNRTQMGPLSSLAKELTRFPGVDSFHLAYANN